MKLSVVMPVYNEERYVVRVLDRVQAVPIEKEIILVDDGSTDGTSRLLDARRDPNLRVVRHDRNSGKGAAIRTALRYVTGDIVLIQDADLEYDPADYPSLVRPILNGEAEVVYGSRFLRPLTSRRIYRRFTIGVWFLSRLASALYRTRITDEATCYKVFRSDVIRGLNLRCDRFGFCPEVTAKVRRNGFRIREVPVAYESRRFEDGKKMRARDGLEAVWLLIKFRFVD